MLSYILAIIFTAVILYLALIFESASFALLGFTSAVFVVLSFLLLLFRRMRLKVAIRIPIATAEKNRMFTLKLIAKNNTQLVIRKINVRVDYGPAAGGKTKHVWLKCHDLKYGISLHNFAVSISEAGAFNFTIKKVRIYDMTGLFYMSIKNGRAANVIVFPDILGLPIIIGQGTRMYYAEESIPDDLNSGNAPDASFDVREFRNGDKMMNVHWKLSARTDELMVRDHADAKSFPVVLLAVPGLSGNEKLTEWLVSLSFTLMDEGCYHYGAWFSNTYKEIKRIRVSDEESFYAFVMTMLSDCAATGTEDIINDYREKYRAENPLHILCPTSATTINVDGTEMTTDNPEKLEIQLN